METFIKIIQINRLVVSPTKIKLFQDKIRFLGHNIYQGKITPIDRVIQFANKFLDEIKDKNQLQRFLRSLNYVSEYFGYFCRYRSFLVILLVSWYFGGIFVILVVLLIFWSISKF